MADTPERDTIERTEIDRTERWLIGSLFRLMEDKDFQEITEADLLAESQLNRRQFYRFFKGKEELLSLHMDLLMEDFAIRLVEGGVETLYDFSLAYFTFWEDHMGVLEPMARSGILDFIGDRLEDYSIGVAELVGKHGSLLAAALAHAYTHCDPQIRLFRVGGFWKLTTAWAGRADRETPEEMALVITTRIFPAPEPEPEPEPEEELPPPEPEEKERDQGPKISFW